MKCKSGKSQTFFLRNKPERGIKMNDNIKGLLRAVADNDYQKAKSYAKVIIANDNSQANKGFCQSIMNKLSTASLNFMELPHDVREILLQEDVAVSFNESRYYLTEREQALAEEILKMYEVSEKLSEMGIPYSNTLLLHGESGTGKTLFGRYVSFRLGLPFVYMNFAGIISSHLGSTGKNLHKAFEYASKNKCVFMIDELDAIGSVRGNSHNEVGEMQRVTIGLMQEMDYISNNTIILAATNRFDNIDDALKRRFKLKHEVKKLSADERESLLTTFLTDVNIHYESTDIQEYCKRDNTQAQIIDDTTRAIAESLKTGHAFKVSAIELL